MKKTIIKKSGLSLIDFLKSSKFGAFLLVCSTILEGFYAFRLFKLTGIHTFGDELTFVIGMIYASLVTGVIVFFALRNNRLIVWAAVIFEFAMNALLDVLTIVATDKTVTNWILVFIAQLFIGSILPLATKAFADEVNKREVSRIIKKDEKLQRNNRKKKVSNSKPIRGGAKKRVNNANK